MNKFFTSYGMITLISSIVTPVITLLVFVCLTFLTTSFSQDSQDLSEPRIKCGENLIIASKHNYNEIVKSLIKSGCDVNVKSELGLMPLYYAIQNRNYENTKALICAGANVNASMILHEAVRSGDTSIVRMVVNAGADSFVRDELGRTPLDIAVQNGYNEIVKILSTKVTINKDYCN
jgi:hypothetical protein